MYTHVYTQEPCILDCVITRRIIILNSLFEVWVENIFNDRQSLTRTDRVHTCLHLERTVRGPNYLLQTFKKKLLLEPTQSLPRTLCLVFLDKLLSSLNIV